MQQHLVVVQIKQGSRFGFCMRYCLMSSAEKVEKLSYFVPAPNIARVVKVASSAVVEGN